MEQGGEKHGSAWRVNDQTQQLYTLTQVLPHNQANCDTLHTNY